ncbi:hypothetical protein RYX36_027835 [Vicia faba]
MFVATQNPVGSRRPAWRSSTGTHKDAPPNASYHPQLEFGHNSHKKYAYKARSKEGKSNPNFFRFNLQPQNNSRSTNQKQKRNQGKKLYTTVMREKARAASTEKFATTARFTAATRSKGQLEGEVKSGAPK